MHMGHHPKNQEHQQHQEHQRRQEHEGKHGPPGEHPGMMTMRLRQELWTQFAIMMLGAWLITSPWTFGYSSTPLAVSDWISGASVIALAAWAMRLRSGLPRWGVVAVGVWVLAAPLVFWAPTAGAYGNDTLVGMLLVAMAILVPGMPGMRMMDGPEIPPGWTYCPSTWQQRTPAIALAFLSLLAARHLAAFQLGHIDTLGEPFFGDGTRRVLESDVSKAWPVSDAGLGVFAYALEMLSGFMGGKDRWRSMPWMVLMFGILVIPLGLVSITLVVLQPVMVGAWCTVCLFTAAAMLLMIPYSVDEIVAMGHFMADVKRRGEPLWINFWRGGTLAGGSRDQRTPDFPDQGVGARAATWGVSWPWNLVATAVLGIAVMAAPDMMDLDGLTADVLHILGPVAITVAIVALAEVVRALRLLNLATGLALIVTPWLSGDSVAAGLVGIVAGLAIALLALRRGPVRERYGTWQALTR